MFSGIENHNIYLTHNEAQKVQPLQAWGKMELMAMVCSLHSPKLHDLSLNIICLSVISRTLVLQPNKIYVNISF